MEYISILTYSLIIKRAVKSSQSFGNSASFRILDFESFKQNATSRMAWKTEKCLDVIKPSVKRDILKDAVTTIHKDSANLKKIASTVMEK